MKKDNIEPGEGGILLYKKLPGKKNNGNFQVYCMHFSPCTIEVNCKIQCYRRWVCFNLFHSEDSKVRAQLDCHASKTINILNCRMVSTSRNILVDCTFRPEQKDSRP